MSEDVLASHAAAQTDEDYEEIDADYAEAETHYNTELYKKLF